MKKTCKQIGDDIGRSKSLVHLKRKEIAETLRPYTVMEGNKLLICDEGIEILKNYILSGDEAVTVQPGADPLPEGQPEREKVGRTSQRERDQETIQSLQSKVKELELDLKKSQKDKDDLMVQLVKMADTLQIISLQMAKDAHAKQTDEPQQKPAEAPTKPETVTDEEVHGSRIMRAFRAFWKALKE